MPEEEIIVSQPGNQLVFSSDTVLFDTIFSTVESVTQYLQVYNPNENAVNITSIELAGGAASAYQVFVNGKPESNFQNLQLLGRDSLLILIKTQVDQQDEDMPFLVKDSLLFHTGNYIQDVKLITWGQDAHFLKGVVIRNDITFTRNRPYVVYDSLWIAEGATLRMEAGTQVYFNTEASLFVDGTLLVEGTLEEPVLLRSDRQDGRYKFNPGQWAGIFFSDLSKNNRMNHAILRNAVVGLFVFGNDADTVPDIEVANTKIRNMANFGIFSVNADVNAYNLLIDSCAYNLVRHVGPGYNQYIHCTFNNNFTLGVEPALFFADTSAVNQDNRQVFNLTLKNNIIWGVRRNELNLVIEKADSRLNIASNLIRTQSIGNLEENNIFNQDPQFINPYEIDYHLDFVSVAIDTGVVTLIREDIEGNLRDTTPDLGAYEYIKK